MVAIIDYGMGNLSSVKKALSKIGFDSTITHNESEIRNSNYIILPGVGSFRKAMDNLHERGLVNVLRSEVGDKKKPILGICLGMQLLADKGVEDGNTEGLGFIRGTVEPIPEHDLPIPHVGWNEINVVKDKYFSHVHDHNFYFVHSYYFHANPEDIAATVNYGTEITAAVQKDNIFGTQFHPEKSQVEGINLLKTFFEVNA